MCGIAGILARDDPAGIEAATARMTAALTHRGPDDHGLELLPAGRRALVLGACRLAIQDPSPAGRQPMHDPRTGNWLVFNGEIYNFRELRAELEDRRIRFTSRSDTEVLLRAYGAWGLSCLPRLRGMFAFALWDSGAQRLVLARDPLGVKPLYCARSGETLLFASEVRALLSSGLVPRRLSQPGLLSYLAMGAVQEPLTILDGIRTLPAGHYAIWEDGEARVRSYWSLADCYRSGPPPPQDRRETVEQVRAALTGAVGRRLVSDVPVGVFLSGGLDSSAITAIAAGQSQRPLQTLSVIIAEQGFSEKEYVDVVRERHPTIHAECRLSDEDLIGLLPDGLGAMDQPTFDGINTYVVARLASRMGLRVVLSGIGGDELFGGYASFHRVPLLNRVRRYTPSILRGPAAQAVVVAGRESDRARKLARWVSADHSVDRGPEALLRELFSPGDRQRLAPGAAGQNGNGRLPAECLVTDDAFNAVSYYDLSHYVRNVLLRDADAMGMAHGVEVREPFLDQDLVQLVAALPGSVKSVGGAIKPLLAGAVGDILPEAILKRRKMGFSFPFARWLRGPLGSRLEETLLDAGTGGQVAEVLDPAAVEQVLARFRAGSGSWVRVWSLYVLKTWGAQHLGPLTTGSRGGP